MRAGLLRGALVGTALALAGCSSEPQIHVTRFHLPTPIARGQLAVEPRNPADKGSLEFQGYANIVGQQLAQVGFTEAPGLAKSELVAAVDVQRVFRDGPPKGPAFSVGVGGGSYGYHGGAGGGVAVPIGRPKPTQIVGTALGVQIKRRSDSTVIWEGRAETEARFDSPEGSPNEAVRRLAAALFKDFPGESGRTITVK